MSSLVSWLSGEGRNQYIPLADGQRNGNFGRCCIHLRASDQQSTCNRRTFPHTFVPEVCIELFGMVPHPEKESIGIIIKFKWLEDNFKPSKKKNEIY